MIDLEALRIPLRRRLYASGMSSEDITELLEELSIEEIFRLGIFYKIKQISKKSYEVDEFGTLQYSNTMKD